MGKLLRDLVSYAIVGSIGAFGGAAWNEASNAKLRLEQGKSFVQQETVRALRQSEQTHYRVRLEQYIAAQLHTMVDIAKQNRLLDERYHLMNELHGTYGALLMLEPERAQEFGQRMLETSIELNFQNKMEPLQKFELTPYVPQPLLPQKPESRRTI